MTTPPADSGPGRSSARTRWSGRDPPGLPAQDQRLTATSSPSPAGSNAGEEPLVRADRLAEVAQHLRGVVTRRRVGHLVVPEHVVDDHDAAGAQQAGGLLDVAGVALLVGVDEHDVVGAVGHPPQHVDGPSGDHPGALVGDARRRVRLLGRPLVLRLDVDGGEDAVRGHALEQPEPGDAGPGPDLDDRPGAHGRGDHPQGGPAARADRRAAQLLATVPRLLGNLALGDEVLGVPPAGRLLCAHGSTLLGASTRS